MWIHIKRKMYDIFSEIEAFFIIVHLCNFRNFSWRISWKFMSFFPPDISQSFTFNIHILLHQIFFCLPDSVFLFSSRHFHSFILHFSVKKWPPLQKDRRGRKGHQSEKGVNARPNTCHARRHFRDFPAEKKSRICSLLLLQFLLPRRSMGWRRVKVDFL